MEIIKNNVKGKSLYDIYEEIYSYETWSYYKIDEINPNDFPFLNSNAQGFIKKYFERGGKSTVLEPDNSLDEKRAGHTVSTFFLGFIIRKFIGKSKIKRFSPRFEYLWFLACLYHDYGYAFEIKNKIEDKSIPELEYKLFKDVQFNKEAMPDNLSPERIQRYDSYRENKDHGITGGKMLFNALKKNYYEKKEKNGNDKDTFYEVINGKKLCLSNKHFPHYFEASMAIVMHNIWLTGPKEKDRDRYESNNLSNLTGTKYKFSKELSLFFILLFADTIEPLKRFENYQPERILRNIFFNIKDDGLLITYSEYITKCKGFDEWKNGVISMTDFIEIKTEKRKKENAILISRI